MKPLVVFYSRTGTTKKVAESIVDSLKCDIEEIETKKSRKGLIGYLLCGKEAILKKLAEINEPKKNASDYDLVIIGTPIWGWNVSSLIRSYITTYNKDFKKVAFFCTQGGSGAEKAFKEMGEICEKEPESVLVLTTKEVKEDKYNDKVKEFTNNIKKLIK